MDPAAAIERALPAFSAVQNGEWDDLASTITGAGVTDALTDDIIALVPIAFGRALMDGMGIEFSPEYSVADSAGNVRPAGRLVDHPVYAAASARAKQMLRVPQGREAVLAAALWSSELAAVNEALHAGSNPSDLVTGPPVLMLSESQEATAPPGKTTAPAAKRPWWRFWG